MGKYSKFVLRSATYAFCAIAILLIGVSLFHYQKAKRTLINKVPILLEETVRINVAQKTQDLFYCVNYVHAPAELIIGEYEEKTATYADTTFTYQQRITDHATHLFNMLQTGMVDLHTLKADDLHHLFDSLLCTHNIHAQSVIGVTASFYTKMNEWSNDTTSLNINYRTVYANQGLYEDINYYACLGYSPLTLWKLMAKKLIYMLLVLLAFIALFFLRHIYIKRKRMRNGITALPNGNYQIQRILFDTKEKMLITKAHEGKLTAQLQELLLMFMQADECRVSKADIKERFWPKNCDPTNNMTSAINRIKTVLKEVDCAYTIISEPENEDFYIFIPRKAIQKTVCTT